MRTAPLTSSANKNIPGIEFCDLPSDANIGAGVTAVSLLGSNTQAFNTSVGAKPTSLVSNTLYTATTAVMEGTGPYSQKTMRLPGLRLGRELWRFRGFWS